MICDVLRDSVPFLQLKKREKHPWRIDTFTKSNTPPWVLLTFFKLYKWYRIVQLITYEKFEMICDPTDAHFGKTILENQLSQ